MLNDYFLNIVDNTENVVLKRFGSDYCCSVESAYRCKATGQDRQNGTSSVPKRWCIWFLPKNLVPSIHLGDEIVDHDANYWTITKIDVSGISGTIRCTCSQLIFEHYLDEFFDLFRQAKTQDISGTFEYGWNLVRTGIRAKMLEITVKKDTSENEVIPEHPNVRRLQSFVVRAPLKILPSDQLRTANGDFHRILKITFPPGNYGWIEIETEKFQPDTMTS